MENQDQAGQQELTRRELLKTLAAAGGALAAAAMLPGKWIKPVVQAGVLPAHAQATDGLEIFNLSLTVRPPDAPEALTEWEAKFYYSDSSGAVNDDALLYAAIHSGCDVVLHDWVKLSLVPATISGGGFSGDIMFIIQDPCATNPNTLYVKLKVETRESNEISKQFT